MALTLILKATLNDPLLLKEKELIKAIKLYRKVIRMLVISKLPDHYYRFWNGQTEILQEKVIENNNLIIKFTITSKTFNLNIKVYLSL